MSRFFFLMRDITEHFLGCRLEKRRGIQKRRKNFKNFYQDIRETMLERRYYPRYYNTTPYVTYSANTYFSADVYRIITECRGSESKQLTKWNDTMQLVLAKSSHCHLSSDYDDSISVYVIMRNGTRWYSEETLFVDKTHHIARVLSMSRMTNSLANCWTVVYEQVQ